MCAVPLFRGSSLTFRCRFQAGELASASLSGHLLGKRAPVSTHAIRSLSPVVDSDLQVKYPEHGRGAGERDLISWPFYTDARNAAGEPANSTSSRSLSYASEFGSSFISPYQSPDTVPPSRYNLAITHPSIPHSAAFPFPTYAQPPGLLDLGQTSVMSLTHFRGGRDALNSRSQQRPASILNKQTSGQDTFWHPGDAHPQQAPSGAYIPDQ